MLPEFNLIDKIYIASICRFLMYCGTKGIGIIACVDGTTISTVTLTEDPQQCWSYKVGYCLNVQMVCKRQFLSSHFFALIPSIQLNFKQHLFLANLRHGERDIISQDMPRKHQ